MVTISGKVLEKWTKKPIKDAVVYINDQETTKTNEKGEFSVEMTTGSAKVGIKKDGYEDSVQALSIVANTALNITLTPEVRAL